MLILIADMLLHCCFHMYKHTHVHISACVYLCRYHSDIIHNAIKTTGCTWGEISKIIFSTYRLKACWDTVTMMKKARRIYCTRRSGNYWTACKQHDIDYNTVIYVCGVPSQYLSEYPTLTPTSSRVGQLTMNTSVGSRATTVTTQLMSATLRPFDFVKYIISEPISTPQPPPRSAVQKIIKPNTRDSLCLLLNPSIWNYSGTSV